ncbi:MAG: uroporphyrinogen-III synthase [Proteobacteria bacterium]|nr:uroporphyrinogen-III synthase [Pseudomonadota bacterium]
MTSNDSTKPLAGARILVTRPAHQAGPLTEAIEQAGGQARLFPALAIGPKPLSEPERQQLHELDQVDTAFFISPNAVHHAFDTINKEGLTLPANIRLACVGAGSEQALAKHGYTNVIRPEHSFTSEGLLSRPEFSDMQGKRVLIFRGNGGRELLKQTLEARGARVNYIECYQRMLPDEDPAPLNQMITGDELDAVSVTSSDALRNLLQLTRDDLHPRLKNLPVFVVSPRMAKVAAELGFDHIHTSKRATDEEILATLVHWRHGVT